MTDIFISHARGDGAWVDTLAAALEGAGLAVWREARLPFGQNVIEAAEQALAKAKAVLVVWSNEALAARNVKDEAGDARDRGVLLAVLKEAVQPPLAFREMAAVDLSAWSGGEHDALDGLVGALTARLTAPPSPPSPTEHDDRTRVTGETDVAEATSFQPRALQIGDVIAHYRIVARLGEGGSGAIYEARNIYNEDERVALKIVLPEIGDRDQFFGFLRAEANALQRVKHDAVVQYRTFGRIPGSDECFLVIEYVEGPTLGAAMRKAPLSPDDVRILARRLAEGLEAAHEQGVIHRDLSPDNVILAGGDPDRATLIDFGIARNESFDPLGTRFAGKLSYAAPEQFGSDPAAVGPWSDLYSLGLLLVAAARGRKLPMGRDLDSAIAMRRSVPALEGVPAALHSALSALLQPDPAKRVRSAAEAAALFAAVPPLPPAITIRDPEPPLQVRPSVQIRQADPAERPHAETPRRRGTWPALVAVALLAAIGVFIYFAPQTGTSGTGDTALVAESEVKPPPPKIPDEPANPRPEPIETPPVPARLVFPRLPPPDPALLARLARPLDPRLAEVIEAAKAAAVAGWTARITIDMAVGGARRAAEEAEVHIDRARDAAEKARAAAKKACAKTTPKNHLCFDTSDGRHYGGQASCKAGGCTSLGYGVMSLPDGWTLEGKWGATHLETGCENLKQVSYYCGDENLEHNYDGYGFATLDSGAIITGLSDARSDAFLGHFDWSGIKDLPLRSTFGRAIAGKVTGPAVTQTRDGATFYGSWVEGMLRGAAFVRLPDGLTVSAYDPETGPIVGELVLEGGRRYLGELGRASIFQAQPNGLGAIYAADGRIEAQGRWTNGELIEDFTATAVKPPPND